VSLLFTEVLLHEEMVNGPCSSLQNSQNEMHKALCDSLNTALALVTISDLITKTNTYLKANQKSEKNPDACFSLSAVKEVARWITRMLEIFGLSASTTIDAIGWTESSSADSAKQGNQQEVALPYVQLLSQFRDRVKHLAISNSTSGISHELLKLSEALRDTHLLPLGVSLEDRNSAIGEPALIKFGDPEELVAAKEVKARVQAEKEEKKETAKGEREREETVREERARVNPKDMFRTEAYSEWDENGLPTRGGDGEELTNSRRKTLRKAWERQRRLYDQVSIS
jgi:cysteinyl-tRNA synthetase